MGQVNCVVHKPLQQRAVLLREVVLGCLQCATAAATAMHVSGSSVCDVCQRHQVCNKQLAFVSYYGHHICCCACSMGSLWLAQSVVGTVCPACPIRHRLGDHFAYRLCLHVSDIAVTIRYNVGPLKVHTISNAVAC